MRHHFLMASCAMACMAANTDQGSAPTQPISAPLDGQIALTAHNDGDGTWSVTRGPGGPVVRSGLPRERALAIVGGATGPYEPTNPQEQEAADERAAIEAEEAVREQTDIFKSDAESGAPQPKVGRIADGDLVAENARLTKENKKLLAQVNKGTKGGAKTDAAVGSAGDGGGAPNNGGE